MAFAATTSFVTVFGNKRIAVGEFTQGSGDTGGEWRRAGRRKVGGPGSRGSHRKAAIHAEEGDFASAVKCYRKALILTPPLRALQSLRVLLVEFNPGLLRHQNIAFAGSGSTLRP